MNCKKCGYLISSQDQVCPNCGEPNEFFVNQPIMPNNGVNTAPVTPDVPVEPTPTTVTPEAAPVVPPVTPVVPETPVTPEAPVEPAPTPVTPEPTPVVPPVAPVTPVMPEQNTVPNSGVNPSVGITQTQITPTKEKSNKGFIFLVIFLLLIIAGLGAFIGYKMLAGDNSSSGGSGNNGGGSANNGGGTQPVEVDISTKISVDGLDFTLPTDITKKEINGSTALYNKTEGYVLYIDRVFRSIDLNSAKQEMMAAESQYKTNLESKGATYIGMNDYSSSGANYFVVTYTINGIYGDQFVTNVLGDYLVAGEVVYTSSNKDNAYKGLSKILNTAKEDTTSSFAPTTETTTDIINGIQVISSIE